MTTFPPLTPVAAPALASLLAAERKDYLAHFRPFAFDATTLAAVLQSAREDRYWAIRTDGTLAGFCMLRGWDAGYSRPAFGVFVAEAFAGRGLAREALAFCIEYCRAHSVETLILSVHHDNHRARRTYEQAGFLCAGPKPDTDQDLYTLKIK